MIREVKPDDAADIVTIYNRYIAETTVTFETVKLSTVQMQQRIKEISHHFPYYVYETEGKVVGNAYVHQWKERAAYAKTLETTIYLSSDVKHAGIGSALMQQIIKDCRQLGYKVLIACITGENLESIQFHKKLGFVQASLFHNVGKKFGRWLDVVDMELQLT